ncbi:MAG: 16S rRNA processing protein RimM [Clostridiaceae bacterium]|nr:16S rRNA processing protein RimM [Clostridiaceae bacterium]
MIEYLQVGKIVNTHGVKGEMKLIPLTDDPRRFDELKWAYIEKDGQLEKLSILDVKYVKGSVMIKFSGIDSMSEAEKYKDCFVLVDREHAVKLPEDSFFICDIIGCSVFDENGRLLGELTNVLETGSNDVYVVKDDSGKEILVPALKSVVSNVSLNQQRIDVIIPKGLLDDEV